MRTAGEMRAARVGVSGEVHEACPRRSSAQRSHVPACIGHCLHSTLAILARTREVHNRDFLAKVSKNLTRSTVLLPVSSLSWICKLSRVAEA